MRVKKTKCRLPICTPARSHSHGCPFCLSLAQYFFNFFYLRHGLWVKNVKPKKKYQFTVAAAQRWAELALRCLAMGFQGEDEINEKS